jgi:hypothetical protein
MNRQDAKDAKEPPRAIPKLGDVLRGDRELGLRAGCLMFVAAPQFHVEVLGVVAVRSS